MTFRNPFKYYSDRKLMLISIASIFLGSFIIWQLNCSFDGVFHMTAVEMNFVSVLFQTITIVVLLSVFLFFSAKIFNKKVRLADCLNVSALSRVPMYLLPLQNVNGALSKQSALLEQGKLPQIDTFLVITSFLSLGVLILSILILVMGYKVAANAKKTLHYVYLVLALILADFVSRYILPYVNI